MITTVHAAKTRLSELLRRVEAGEEVIIARDDTPVARIVPAFPETAGRTFGAMRGQARVDAEVAPGNETGEARRAPGRL